jgi:hypothetical protein
MKQNTIFMILIGSIIISSCKREDLTANPGSFTSNMRTASLSATCHNADSLAHFISLEEAYRMVNVFQKVIKTPNGLCELIGEGAGWTLAESFPSEALYMILNQKGCCRFRIYYGLDLDNRLHQVLVGVDSHDEDILFKKDPKRNPPGGPGKEDPATDLSLIVEMGVPCPQACGGNYQN